jgi:hypothetical protein
MFGQNPGASMNPLEAALLHQIRRKTMLFGIGLLLALLVFNSGCATAERYVEPAPGTANLPELQVEAPLWLLAIDGKKFSNKGWSDFQRVRILPGPHVLKLSFSSWETIRVTRLGETHLLRRRISSMPAQLQFFARPQKVYVVGYRNQLSPTEISGVWQPFINEFEPFDPAKP